MLTCAKCHKSVSPEMNFCSSCGTPLSTKANSQSRQEQGQTEPTHMGVIVFMWLLTLAYFFFWAQKVNMIATLCGFCSFVFGIALSLRRNPTDRTNGLVRVGVGVVMGLITFSISVAQRQ